MKLFRALINLVLISGLIFIFVGVFVTKKDDIETIINTYIFPNKQVITLGEVNEYYRDYDFNFVQNTTNFSPHSFQEILNIYYTVINAGKSEFTFYCPTDYEGCLDDVQTLANNQDLLSDINNYVHPFNGFSHIATEYDTLGRVTITIDKLYSPEKISLINKKVDELYVNLVNDNLSVKDNIKAVHDYIINTTKYDSNRSDNNIILYESDTAYGPLFEGYGICGGYTDLMELFLERMNIKSFKVSSDLHVWNAVMIDNYWYNLDLTWDDPVSDDGLDYLQYNYFLINTDTLLSIEVSEHNFSFENYSELKGAY